MRNFSRFVAAIAGLACAASLAFAAEQTILGKSMLVKDPGSATKRKVSASGNEKASPNTIVGNPTLAGSAGGAILQVFAFGATSSNQVFLLHSGTSSTGKPFWSALGTVGFKYRDPKGDNGAVKSVNIKRTPSGKFSIKAKITGKNGTVDVVPPNPGTSGCVALKIGEGNTATGDRYSISFGPDSNIKNTGSKLFKAKKPSIQAVCPGGGSTTTTTTSPSTTSTSTTTTPSSSTTTTTMYGSPSRAFLTPPADLLE
jgi:hypothetical protein